jgi:general nucleoside transport system permease protein
VSLRVERRGRPSWRAELGVLAGAILLASLAGCGLFALAGAPPLEALAMLVQEPFGSAYGISETLVRTVPLAFCALAVALALKIDMWNIGAEGQLYLGALAGSWLALHGPALPGPLRLPSILVVGFVAGALWAVIPGLLKIYGRVNEIISTLMLNYVAIAWVELMVYGPWKGADGFPYTALFEASWRLPLLYKRVHAGLILVLLLALVLWLVERRTVLGYEIRMAGASPAAARYGGVPVLSRLLLVMALAGGAAGLAGVCEVAGVEYRLHAGISPGYGYTAIIIAFLARRNLLMSVVVAFLFAALVVGGDGVQVSFPGVSAAVVQVFQGLLLLLVLAGGWFTRFRLVWRRGGP